MSTYKDIQHILIAIHIYAFEKNTHYHAQGIASKFTPNHNLNICYHKLPTHIWNIYHTNFYCFTHIYLYACWKANYVMHTLAFKREFHAIIYSFRKWPQYSFRKILVHTLQRNFMAYVHIYTHHWKVFSMLPIFTHIFTYHWKVFPTLPSCQVPLMGQPKF